MKIGKKIVISGLIWSYGERILADLVSFAVSLVLARLLEPEHYGEIAIVTVFMTIVQVFVTNGFSDILIQKESINEEDFSTAFWMNIIFSIVLYVLLFALAPYIARGYKIPSLSLVIKVMGIGVIIAAFSSIQKAFISRNMDFRKFFFSTLLGTVISAIIGIIFAYKGMGVWALVAQYLSNMIIDTIMLTVQNRWKPRKNFSVERAKEIYLYGWKIIVYTLLGALYNEFRSFVIGIKYSSTDLAYYNYGRKFPRLIVDNIVIAIGKVFFPTFSNMQNDIERLCKVLRKIIKLELYVCTPFLVGLAAVSDNFVEVVLTSKWSSCIPFVIIFCASYISKPITATYLQAIKAVGRNGVILMLQCAGMVINIFIVLVAIFRYNTVNAVAYGALCGTLIELFLYMLALSSVLGYRIYMQLGDILHQLFYSAIMAILVIAINFLGLPVGVTLVIQILAGIFTYLFISVIFKVEEFHMIEDLLKKALKRKEG